MNLTYKVLTKTKNINNITKNTPKTNTTDQCRIGPKLLIGTDGQN